MIRQMRALFSELYREITILVLIICPLLAIAVSVILTRSPENVAAPLLLGLMLCLILSAQVLTDHFHFGGLLVPDAKQLELFRSSRTGDDLYERMLTLDICCRRISFATTFLAGAVVQLHRPLLLAMMALTLGAVYLTTNFILRIIRRFDGPLVLIGSLYLGLSVVGFTTGLSYGLVSEAGENRKGCVIAVIIALACTLSGVLMEEFTKRRCIKRWKEQYYDKT